jgi:hypothetical protein
MASEDFIVERFSARLEAVENPGRKKMLKEAFALIASSRTSELMHAVLASAVDEEVKPKMAVERAYRLLEANDQLEDTFLIQLYEIRVCFCFSSTTSSSSSSCVCGH